MDRWHSMRPMTRSGLLLCFLLALVALGWATGFAWVAVPAALAAFGVSACAGTDSRAPGDWGRVDG